MKHPLQIIGLHPGSLEPPQFWCEKINNADVLSGGNRLLSSFPDFKGERLPFFSPVSRYAEELQRLMRVGKKIVLLADGDPLLFGIAESIVKQLGKENVLIKPAVSTVQCAASAIGKSWKDFKIISLHGRDDYFPLYATLQKEMHCAVYTDKINSPAAIAHKLVSKGVKNYHMMVFSEMGTKSESIKQGPLKTFVNFTCDNLNLVLLMADNSKKKSPVFGRDDTSFTRHKDLITKLPVRATGLALLSLQSGQTVWDLGAGCGSVSIEASFIAENAKIFAVEKEYTRFEMINENIRKFKAWAVEVVHGEMPEILSSLPDPDRIFMGGGIGKDDKTVLESAMRLKSGGRIVVHAILMGSVQRTKETFEEMGWQWQAMQLQANVSDRLGGDVRFKAQNPVTIIWADKP